MFEFSPQQGTPEILPVTHHESDENLLSAESILEVLSDEDTNARYEEALRNFKDGDSSERGTLEGTQEMLVGFMEALDAQIENPKNLTPKQYEEISEARTKVVMILGPLSELLEEGKEGLGN